MSVAAVPDYRVSRAQEPTYDEVGLARALPGNAMNAAVTREAQASAAAAAAAPVRLVTAITQEVCVCVCVCV